MTSQTGDVFIVDLYSHSPKCSPTLATPNCKVNCAPYEWPHNKNPSCLSRPRLSYPLRDADAQWVTVEAVSSAPGYYKATYEAEVKDRYDIDVALMKQGGLNAYYFDNVWLIDLPDISRVDSTINFQWGDGVITTYGKDYVSIRWSGKLKPAFSEMYTIFAYADDGVRVWIDKQLVIDKWGTCCNETFGTVKLAAGHYHDIIVEYQELKDDARMELRWGSYSVPKQIIPSTALYYRQYTCNTPYTGFDVRDGPPPHHTDKRHQEITVGPSKYPNANYTYSYQYNKNPTGVAEWSTGRNFSEVGIASSFRVQLMDMFNNSLEVFDTTTESAMKFTWSAAPGKPGATGFENAAPIHSSHGWWPTDESGIWEYNYTAQQSGQYWLNVQVNDKMNFEDIQESPYHVNVSCGPTNTANSIYYGSGATASTAGKTAYFYIQSKDQFLNNKTNGGDNIWVVMAGPEPLHAQVEYQTLGRYRVMYTPRLEGTYNIKIYMNEILFSNTPPQQPMPSVMTTAEAAPYFPYCTVAGSNLKSATAGHNVSLTVDFFDKFNNSIDISSPQALSVQIVGPKPYNTTRNVPGFISTVSSGDHIITYKPQLTGDFDLHVRIAGQELLSSPYNLQVIPGEISDWKTTAYGDFIVGTRQGAVQQESVIYVQAKDSEENLLEQDVSANISATLTCGSNTVRGKTSYVGPRGLHKIQITPVKKGGACTVKVFVRQAQINHSPYTVKILPAQAHYNTSSFEQITSGVAGVNNEFDITAVDQLGNALDSDTATSDFIVDVYGPNYQDEGKAPYSVLANMTNSGNGTYHADWKPKESGTYTTYVHLRKKGVGLYGRYYTDMDLTESNFYVDTVDADINFDWKLRNPFGDDFVFPTDYWSASWYGQIKAPKSETFRLFADLAPDCGVKIWINYSPSAIEMSRNFPAFLEANAPVLDAWQATEGSTEVFTDVLFDKDKYYNIFIQFRDVKQEARFRLLWESPSTPKQVIPGSAFSTLRNVTQSPFDVTVVNTATFHNLSTTTRVGDLNLTYAAIESKGIPTSGIAGKEFNFAIQLRDMFGNLQRTGGETSKITVTLDEIYNRRTVSATTITDNSNGTYIVVVEPTLIGTHYLNVKYDGKPILGSPWTISVTSGGAFIQNSWAQGIGYNNATVNKAAKFSVYVRDMENNMRDAADTIKVVTSGPKTLKVGVRRLGGGVYECFYTPVKKGTYTFQVYINNMKLNTTSTVTVVPDIASAVDTTFVTSNGTGSSLSATVTTYDNQGNQLDIGGHKFYARLVKTYSGAIVRGVVTDNSDGTYTIAFAGTAGEHMMYINMAKGRDSIGDGLTAKYYTNPWLNGEPVVTRVDPYVNMMWGEDLVTPTAKDYVSATWEGYVRPTYAEAFQFTVEGDEGVRLTVDDTLIINNFLDSAGTFTGNYTFPNAGMLYKFKLEWRENTGPASCKLFWQSASQAYGLVEQKYLHSAVDAITNSPIRIKAT